MDELRDIKQLLSRISGPLEIVPVGLSALSQQKIDHLAKRGFTVLAPFPPRDAAVEKALTVLMQGHTQQALDILANDIGQQSAMHYAKSGEHIRTGDLSRELLRITWTAKR
ncbi:MAG: hypothetical protein E6Q97_36640 [Desulfurellales bacterium]|nr:MAG: hypothetical protein E6Q97_36640 [Desulfurellales bacterium]